MKTQVFAFASIDDQKTRLAISDDLLKGKSRFEMWDQTTSLKNQLQGNNNFLLRAHIGDWIVHIDLPGYGQCVALKVTGQYGFDEGIQCPWGNDFNNFIPVDPDSMRVFHRIRPNIITTLNTAPWQRAFQIIEVDEFLKRIGVAEGYLQK